ncbi:proline racemase [Colletotrichum karsti]|uniref:trans-L-3-hydroxyproline dehydratase n=1 Tax=Colletotrichum karsti TaxID=1095194 RepID=A0A9P6LN37_9PEZI|nr:proline racemase [Colletotrichum karsti]KAF9878147.1 proline racemase [Colletotrichum karsti]
MHIPPPLHLTLLFASLASSTITGPETPSRFPQVPSPVTTPAPDRDLVTHRLLRARQGPPRSSDGRTNFIGWYTASDTWVSATCPSESYFAADETYGVCCPRNNANCDLATVCGGANNNFAVGPSGLADCGPSNTCDTVTVIQTKGSDDARRIIFCIARSEQYVLPMTWYRVTYPRAVAMSLPSFIRPFVGSEIRTVEMHTSGEPARIIYAGYPDIPGKLLEQRSLAQSEHDHIRRSLIYEPRGHQDMYGAALRPRTELVDSGEAHMGALFLTHEGYGMMCGHATIALGRFLVDCTEETIFPRRKELEFDPKTQEIEVRLHAPVGVVRIKVPAVKADGGYRTDMNRPITFLSIPTFATAINLSFFIPEDLRWAELGDRENVTVDVGYGGAFYIIVSASALGFPPSLAKPNFAALRNAAEKIKRSFDASPLLRTRLTLPDDKRLQSIYGVMVTDAGSDDEVPAAPGCKGAETGVYFFSDQQIDRSPTGSVVQARVAVAVAKGERELGESWTYHSLVSRAQGGFKSAFVGKAVEKIDYGKMQGIRVEVSGRAFYTGSSTFVAEEDDEVGKGFSFQALGV